MFRKKKKFDKNLLINISISLFFLGKMINIITVPYSFEEFINETTDFNIPEGEPDQEIFANDPSTPDFQIECEYYCTKIG